MNDNYEVLIANRIARNFFPDKKKCEISYKNLPYFVLLCLLRAQKQNRKSERVVGG